MSDTVAPAPTPVVPEDIRMINQAANLSNAVTAVFGLSGGGKSGLADTAVEYAFEEFGKTSLGYVMDPGGFGTKRLALIRAGILQVWDPSNHNNQFETMEMISLGAWPEKIVDPERGYAEPDVKLVLPRQVRYTMICPNGHPVERYATELMLNARGATPQPCPTCQQATALGNALRVDKEIVRHAMFKNVGFRFYDSVTAMNERGLIIELPNESAKGSLPVTAKGGSLLSSADALISGTVKYGSGSEAQVGFMQNRTYQWLTNIRNIPDQVVPPVCTFGVEVSKQDDESAGVLVLGPRIAGKARTAALPGWVGNCVHAESYSDETKGGAMRFRLWLTNHVDPKDPRKIPYLSKTRGVPRGLPPFLEDPWDDDPVKRAANAWTVCSLGNLFRMLDKQARDLTAEYLERYKNVPAAETGEEIIGTVVARQGAGSAGAPSAAGVTSTTAAVVSAPRGVRRVVGARPATVPAVGVPIPAPAVAVSAPAVPAPATSAPPAAATTSTAPAAPPTAPTVAGTTAAPTTPQPQHAAAVQAEKPIGQQLAEAADKRGVAPPAVVTQPPVQPVAAPVAHAPTPTGARPVRRVPRPPT